MAHQDTFYLEKESDAFFDRWFANENRPKDQKLRDSKKQILEQLAENMDMRGLKVIEVGCFIGDLPGYLKSEHGCDVYGIEASVKACHYAKERFDVDIEHSTFAQSSFFNLNEDNREHFDLIICDDVLSWMSRDLILSSLGVMDWMLKPEGSIFLRDFSPNFGFAYENHHWPGDQIYNFKQPGGHRQFFLMTGKYLERSTQLRSSGEYQNVDTSRPDSLIWADSVLTKMKAPLHPVEKLK
ncbi:MAG: class I SAM-dependent methyltransferase [Candidatus Puniceispirillaceae bacterium]